MSDAGKGRYTFIVARSAHKDVIKKEIQKRFSVTVTAIVTNILKGRTKRGGQRRVEIKTSPFKKATVTVKPGEKIGLFEAGAQQKL